MAQFRDVLRELRKRRGLTQQMLAEQLGISFSTVSMYERGNRCPDMEMLGRIADFFGVSVDYLHGKAVSPAAEGRTGQSSMEAVLARLKERYGVTPEVLLSMDDTSGGRYSLADSSAIQPPPPADRLTPHERAVLAAYRQKPEVQPFVDKLLDVKKE
ncbi:MAG: helix-turn-helix domain-containing protein [Clostridia bacterium]|nr:helix-turn-helix domain-containing protein [Clostridia bacterium]